MAETVILIQGRILIWSPCFLLCHKLVFIKKKKKKKKFSGFIYCAYLDIYTENQVKIIPQFCSGNRLLEY